MRESSLWLKGVWCCTYPCGVPHAVTGPAVDCPSHLVRESGQGLPSGSPACMVRAMQAFSRGGRPRPRLTTPIRLHLQKAPINVQHRQQGMHVDVRGGTDVFHALTPVVFTVRVVLTVIGDCTMSTGCDSWATAGKHRGGGCCFYAAR
jgi:hypothetical protein